MGYEHRDWQLKTIYPKCIKAERYWNLNRVKVWKVYKKARNMYINYKKLHKIAGRKCVNVCTNQKREKGEKNVHSPVQETLLEPCKIYCNEKKMLKDSIPNECQKMSISVQA